jgi:hypothetical protein
MRLDYVDIFGRRYVREFNTWAELCEFVVDLYPLLSFSGDVRRLFK